MDELCKMEKLNFHGLQRVSTFLQLKNRNASQNYSDVTVTAKCVAVCGEIHQSAFVGDFRAVFHSGHHFLVQRVLKYTLLDRNGHSVYKQNRHDPNTQCPLLHRRSFHKYTQFTLTTKCMVLIISLLKG